MAENKRPDLPGLGERLRQAREAAGLSQAQVARLLGIHRPAVTDMENEARKVSAGEVKQLAELYKVSLEWLTGTDIANRRVKMAARKLESLKDRDLETALRIIDSLWRGTKKTIEE
jgi:transcriptional regulator with XRE-family HTH domain